MPLTKPNKQLRNELNYLGLGLEQIAGGIINITKDSQDIDVTAVLKLVAKLYDDADRLAALADEVGAGLITRTESE
ncbi:hypothetical protein [Pseudomonas libanensis]|uniref:Peptidase n=1 Tax=Pseudomonas libanensis TaxID=75588 RepID=A0ABR5M0N5_9PSED|nr:hypothetical protein [Pseudomonas libanensis]KPG69110.1 peptidase [Pseudomonas libanensis]